MSTHSELFACYGAPLVMANHGDPNSVQLLTARGEEIPCEVASLGPINYVNETVTHEAGNITDRVARRSITVNLVPPLDAVAVIDGDRWAIEEITSSASLSRVSLIRVMASSYGNKQL